MAARDTALFVLMACRTRQAWSDGALKEYIARDKLDGREAALATRLVYSVLQNRMLLDFELAAFLKGHLRDLQPVVLDVLRLGACQLLLFDKIPDSAAVNEAVKQARRHANPRAAALVNGLLRTIIRNRDTLPEPPDLETRYSHPAALTALLRRCVGEEKLEPLLRSHNEAPPITVQVNTLRGTAAALQARLKESDVEAAAHPWCPDCLVLEGTGNLERLESYREGLFYVQDPAARLAAMAAGTAPGMAVLDCCAAPGGKSFAAAIAMENRGTLVPCDLHAHKVPLLQKGADRLGLSVLTPRCQDATEDVPEFHEAFDCVMADVPCSGLGVIRKKPDIRYRDLGQLAGLPPVQRRILETQSAYVRPGGVLLYSTCTIVPEENEGVIRAFLADHPEFSREAAPIPLDNDGEATLLPCDEGTDGFYFCRMRKVR
ncbi:MAG: 16S rRNA (cytosine(967)-C(5))-methyltransferase RsmB [Oscillospiraceae bacterium]|nr:16S rRNA (cytosine(967)-C(5))-methyltransferase RsmB [Oscillospiraceae bacterium]